MITKITYLLVLSFLGLGAFGQSPGGMPVEILANEHTTTTLFFPSGIAKTIDPAANYKFEYGQIDPSIGVVKGKKGNPSNLTVITDDGYIYSFALSYSDNIEIFNFMLTSDMAVGRTPNRVKQSAENSFVAESSSKNISSGNPSTENTSLPDNSFKETPPAHNSSTDGPSGENSSQEISSIENQSKENQSLEVDYPDAENDEAASDESFEESAYAGFEDDGQGDLYNIDKEEYYRIFCENNYLQKTIFRRTFRQNKRVVLKLNNILVDRDEIYFVLQVENNSRKEYKVNGLSFFRKSGVGQLQKILKPRYVYNLQEKIDPQSINEVVFVFKRFTISSKEEVYVVLDELENNRMVMLPLDNKQINSPTN